MDTVLEQVKRERDDLKVRISNICKLTGDGKYPSVEFLTLSPANRILLERQLELMKEYRDILDVRIELMEGVKPQEP